MRTRLIGFPLALVLVLASAGLASADTTPPGGEPGGLDVAVTSTSVNAKTGLVTVSGAVTCEVDFDYVGVELGLSQVVGRLTTLRGWGYTETGCLAADGSVPFTFSFYAESGRFAPGKAMINVGAWGEGNCAEDPETGDWNCENWGSVSYGPTAIRLSQTR